MELLALISSLVLVFLNGFFVATEFAIVKVRSTRVEELITQNKKGAKGIRHMVSNLDSYLSATQLGITFASLGLGSIGEPAFANLIEPQLTKLGYDNPVLLHTIAVSFAFAIISFMHIVIGELAPKSLAIVKPEYVAAFAAYPMRIFHTLFYPFIYIFNGLAGMLLRLVGIDPQDYQNSIHSDDELRIILSQARSGGLLSETRAKLLERALGIRNKTARHVLVPRNEVVFLDTNLSHEENLERIRESPYSYFPLCDRELDHSKGVIHIRDFLEATWSTGASLLEFARPVTYLPETMTADRLLTEFNNRNISLAIIVDEYGGASGIVTASELVGEIMGDLHHVCDSDVVELASGAYEVDGSAELEELEETLGVSFDKTNITTIAGFLMREIGRMPNTGDRIRCHGLLLHVTAADGPKVRRVRIQKLKKRP